MVPCTCLHRVEAERGVGKPTPCVAFPPPRPPLSSLQPLTIAAFYPHSRPSTKLHVLCPVCLGSLPAPAPGFHLAILHSMLLED